MVKKIGQIFWLLLYPLKKILYFIFKYIILPIYQLLYLIRKEIKRNTEEQSSNILVAIFTHKYLLYALIIILSSFVLINNLTIKTAAAEDLGKKSLLYKIAQGDEFEEIIEEVSLIDDQENGQDKLAKKESSEIDFLEPSQGSLTKTEPSTGELATTTLRESAASEGLAAETLQKTSAPATFTTPRPREKIQEYVVQSGDTISSIAEKFSISINSILWANDLSGLSIIRPGDKLTILPVSGTLHKVKQGDTISGIAKKYNISSDKISDYNQLIDDNQLAIGQLVIVPGGEIRTTYARTSSGFAAVFKPSSSQRKSGGFIWPTISKRITQYYHWRHHAIDIGGKTGSPIYAALSGKVIKASWTTGYGYNITIDHGGGQKTLYAHLSKMYVKKGEQITQGAAIGALGSTGWSTGPHVHFEIIINGTKVNPLSYL